MNDELSLPKYMHEHVRSLKCRNCLSRLATSGVMAVCVRRSGTATWCLHVEVTCGSCGKLNKSYTPERRLSPLRWARQLAEDTPRRRRPRRPHDAFSRAEEAADLDDEAEQIAEEAARSFFATERMVLDCALAHFAPEEGGQCIAVTFATHGGDVDRPIAIGRDDARLLAAGLLVALASRGDPFARVLLDEHFPAAPDGRFHWPRGMD